MTGMDPEARVYLLLALVVLALLLTHNLTDHYWKAAAKRARRDRRAAEKFADSQERRAVHYLRRALAAERELVDLRDWHWTPDADPVDTTYATLPPWRQPDATLVMNGADATPLIEPGNVT